MLYSFAPLDLPLGLCRLFLPRSAFARAPPATRRTSIALDFPPFPSSFSSLRRLLFMSPSVHRLPRVTALSPLLAPLPSEELKDIGENRDDRGVDTDVSEDAGKNAKATAIAEKREEEAERRNTGKSDKTVH